MKTKAWLLLLSLAVVSVSSSFAQIGEGFVRVTLAPGEFKLICNPLNYTTTNYVTTNSLDNILSTAPSNVTKLYRFDAGSQAFTSTFTKRAAGWVPNGSITIINPGEGFFIQSTALTNLDFIFFGFVPQGANVSIPLVAGFNLVASHFPLGALIETDLKLPAANGEQVYLYRSGVYQVFTRRPSGWAPAEPVVNVGEGFYFWSRTAKAWTNSFFW